MTPPDATPFVSRLADRAVSVVCPPKINFTLAVGRPRPDGLHPIASLMLGLDVGFADFLTLESLDDGPSTFAIAYADDAPLKQAVDWSIQDDLAYRAHVLLQEHVGRSLPIRAQLTKRIPAGSGLGGGSSDAAGMLVGLNLLFNLGLADDNLVGIGRRLGADVAFAVHVLRGRPAAWVTGTGEQIETVSPPGPLDLLLILPEVRCPTGRVYRTFDEMGGGIDFDATARPWLGASPVLSEITPANDLAPAAFRVAPTMIDIAKAARGLGIQPRVTGSGSAMFAVCQSQAEAEHFRMKLAEMIIASCATRHAG